MDESVPPPRAAGCPFSSSKGNAGSSEILDKRNMMPVLPQTPAGNQQTALSTARETSSIPKSDEGGKWIYPSPQQFYHALLRKNKGAEEDMMNAVVLAHNVTNERTWRQILEWEQLHERTCANPALLRFVGRQEDFSIGARFSTMFSYRGVPFDRHDWFVDRCGQKLVRYVIDYYDDPHANDKENLEITIEARPALDSAGAFVDRLRRPMWQLRRMWTAVFGGGGRLD